MAHRKWDKKVDQFSYFKHRRIDQTMNLLEDKNSKMLAIEVVTHIGEFTMRQSAFGVYCPRTQGVSFLSSLWMRAHL